MLNNTPSNVDRRYAQFTLHAPDPRDQRKRGGTVPTGDSSAPFPSIVTGAAVYCICIQNRYSTGTVVIYSNSSCKIYHFTLFSHLKRSLWPGWTPHDTLLIRGGGLPDTFLKLSGAPVEGRRCSFLRSYCNSIVYL